jgi:DNA-binding CsgD family transcriptional regulator
LSVTVTQLAQTGLSTCPDLQRGFSRQSKPIGIVETRTVVERAQAASEILAAWGLPALVLDASGKILAANHFVEKYNNLFERCGSDRFVLNDCGARTRLRAAIANICVSGFMSATSFPAHKNASAGPMVVVHLLPFSNSAPGSPSVCSVIAVLTPVIAPEPPPVELLRSLFDLTMAEARVARALANRKKVEEIASDGGVSRNTIRKHVRSVLEKTGCRRQLDLVLLLMGASLQGVLRLF